MRRRIIAVSTVVLSLVAASCRDATTPAGPAQMTRVQKTARVVNPAEVEALIIALFGDPSHESSMLSHWDNIQKAVSGTSGSTSSLESHVNNSVKFTLEDLALNALVDPDGDGPLITATGAARLLAWIFEYAGYTPTTLPDVPEGTDAFWHFVDPNATDYQTFVTSFGDGAVVIPPGSFDEPTLLAMVRLPQELTVNTPYPNLSRTFDVSISPVVPFESMAVLVCPLVGVSHEVNERAVVAHQVDASTVEYLDRATFGNLTCPEDIASAWREKSGFLAQRAGQLASLASSAWKLVAPQPLYAGHAAIGGLLFDELSPVVAVDPYLGTTITPSAISSVSYGNSVTMSANLAVSSGPAQFIGNAVANASVTASITGGASQTATTDAVGNVSFTFSGLDAGSHTVTYSFAGMLTPENAPEYGATSATATFTVNPAALTITADNASREYGQPNPAFTGSVSGALNGDVITLSFSTTATATSLPGTYPIVPVASGAALVNYTVTAVNGTLTIRKIPVSVTVTGGTYYYGTPASTICQPAFSTTVNSAWYSGTLTCLVNGAPLASPAPVGTYSIVAGGLTSAIYDFTFGSATVTVKYNDTVGHYFISPVPNTQYQQGRTLPAKFQLFMADGVTPVLNATAYATVRNIATNALLSFSPTTFSVSNNGTYQLNIRIPADAPIGFYMVTAHLNDGSVVQSPIEIKAK